MKSSAPNPAVSRVSPDPRPAWQQYRFLRWTLPVMAAMLMLYQPRTTADSNSDTSTERPALAAAVAASASPLDVPSARHLPVAPDSAEQQNIPVQEELLTRVDAVHSTRIVMHATESAARLADQLTTLLEALGADQVEQRIVDAVPDNNQIRYYHPADREAGQVVGDVMKLVFEDIAIRDFESYQPSPSEGLVEIWLR